MRIIQIILFKYQMLNSKEWNYLNEGQSHFIFSYQGSQKIYIHKILRLSKLKPKITQIDKLFDLNSHQVYDRFLDKLLFVKQYIKLYHYIDYPEKQKIQFIQELNQSIQHKKSKNKKSILPIDPETKLEVMDNLINLSVSEDEPIFFLELKPKTSLNDLYTEECLKRVAVNKNIDLQKIKQILRETPQQLRYKNSKRRILDNNTKNNIDSSKFYKGQLLNYLDLNKNLIQKFFVKQVETNDFVISKSQVNQTVHSILCRQQIAEKLLAVQLLYNKPIELLQRYPKQAMLDEIIKASADQLSDVLIDEANLLYKTIKQFNYQNQQHLWIETAKLQSTRQQLLDVLRFLVSEVWRDVSIFLRVKIQSISQYDETKIKVNQDFCASYFIQLIDLDMRSLYRTNLQYCRIDEKYLEKLIDYLYNH